MVLASMFFSTWLKVVIIIVVFSCCSSPIYSARPIITSKEYNFGNKQVIVGKNNVDNATLVYAVCKSTLDHRSAKCKIKFESDVFDDSKPKSSCNLNLQSELTNGKLDILEINFWGQNKAIFVWRDINQNNIEQTKATIVAVNLENCELKAHKLKIDNRLDNKPQIFIIPLENSYEVTFMDDDRCGIMFCKITVSVNGTVSEAEDWFPNVGLVYGLEQTNNDSRKLLISYGETYRNYHEKIIVLLGETEWHELGSYTSINDLGWTTSNGKISYCTRWECFIFDHNGGSRRRKILYMIHYPTMYTILYNLPNFNHLFLGCTTDLDGNYRILRISRIGEILYRLSMDELKCAQKPKVLTGKFFIKVGMEYCLSIFYSLYHTEGKYKFSRYCFFGLDIPTALDI